MALLPNSEPETNAGEREMREMRAAVNENPFVETFVDTPLTLLTEISDRFNAVGKIDSAKRITTSPALKLVLTTQMARFDILKTTQSQRFFTRMFNRFRFDLPELSNKKLNEQESAAEDMVDELSTIDSDFDHFLNAAAPNEDPLSAKAQRQKKRKSLLTLCRSIPGKFLFYRNTNELNREKSKAAEDRRVHTDYGSFNLGYTKEQFAKVEKMLVPSGQPEGVAKDMTHQVTAMIMYELLSRKIMIHHKTLAELYSQTTADGSLSFTKDIEPFFPPKEKNGYVKKKEYKQWLQSGAVKLPYDSLTVNVGSVGEVVQFSLDLPSEVTMQAFYRSGVETTEAFYDLIRTQVSKKLLSPDKVLRVDKNIVQRAFSDTSKPETTSLSPADVHINFARESTMDLNRIIELNNLTGDPIEATHHVHTIYLDEQTGEPSGMQTRTHHPKNFGKVAELLMSGAYPEFDTLAEVLSTVNIDTTESLQIDQFERTLLENLHEQPEKRIQRVAEAQREIPTVIQTTVLEKADRDDLRSRIDRLNGRVKKEMFKALGIQKGNEYLLSLDTLTTFAVGLSGNIYGESCVHMNYLIETTEGDITPCLLPIPWNESFKLDYVTHLYTPDQFVASKERGLRIAQAFGFFTADKQLALDENTPASLSVRLALAAGGMKEVFQSISAYTDAVRGQYIQSGKGGLSSRLGRMKRFTPSTTDYYTNQPSLSIIENENGDKELTIEIDSAKRRLVEDLTQDNGEVLKRLLDFVLRDLEAYEKSLHRFLDLSRFRNN